MRERQKDRQTDAKHGEMRSAAFNGDGMGVDHGGQGGHVPQNSSQICAYGRWPCNSGLNDFLLSRLICRPYSGWRNGVKSMASNLRLKSCRFGFQSGTAASRLRGNCSHPCAIVTM